MLTRAKGKAGGGGGRGSEDFKKRASSTAWEGQRQRPSPTYACSSTVFVSRPLGEARHGRAREDGHWQYCENGLFRCLSRLASEPATAGRRGCPQLWSFPAPLLVSEGSHPALAARGCKMLLPGFSTTLCPAPSLLPPNIPDVRSTGAWIGGVSRDIERPPARSLPDAGPCQLPALTNIPFLWIQGNDCRQQNGSDVETARTQAQPTSAARSGRAGARLQQRRKLPCPGARMSGIYVPTPTAEDLACLPVCLIPRENLRRSHVSTLAPPAITHV